MMEWSEYISYLLSYGKDLENLTISLDEGHTETEIPPLIRVSIIMLDKMIERQGQRNVIVFPEHIQSVFIFTLMKLFHNILLGKIQSNYDPTDFTVGEKLKVGNAVVEYLGNELRNGKTYLNIRLADIDKVSAPINYLPVFQRVSTNRRLSKYARYVAEKKKIFAAYDDNSTSMQKLAYVTDMKTHMESSIFAMTSISPAKEMLSNCTIGGKKVNRIFYIAHTDYEGKFTNISPGQMAGTPAIVFASDLYAISSAAEDNHPIQSIIIDGSNTNVLMGELDALDDLLRLNIPIVCITDIENSFELEAFSSRGFNIWRWDKDSLTEQLYDMVYLSSDKKIRNCAHHTVQYLKSDGEYICIAMKCLSRHRRETENQSPQMMRLFERLNNLIFSALRATIPFSETEIALAGQILSECTGMLASEASYLDKRSIKDYEESIFALQQVYRRNYQLEKNAMLKEFLSQHPSNKIILVIPEKAAKSQIQDYWYKWCRQQGITGKIIALFPSEYYSWAPGNADITIICGWLKRAIMRKVIYSFITSSYVVLLYDYENRWKNHDTHFWEKALSKKDNKEIVERAFSTDKISVSTVRYDKPVNIVEQDTPDELGEIELVLRENKYRQYVNGNSHPGSELVSAIPINFAGGYLAFFRVSHEIVSATKIITSGGDKIETKLPADLKIGDFIVVRETDRDLVREMADIILSNSGKRNLRSFATKWREALQIELLFCTEDEFCEKIKAAGCNKGIATIKRWIDDENVIAPQSKDDLKILAAVTENETVLEMLDSIYEAAQEVRKAHVLAGRKLSEQLRLTLAEELRKIDSIDPFNIWDPIDMEIEGIGNVKVLKIIDVGTEIEMDATDTNKLIEE